MKLKSETLKEMKFFSLSSGNWLLALLLNSSLLACSSSTPKSEVSTKSTSKKIESSNSLSYKEAKLGLNLTDQGLFLKVQFNCQQESGQGSTSPYKIRAFSYKIHVLENDKELKVEGTQRAWLDTNLTVLKLNYAKTRKITFKNLEISTNKWIRSFSDAQLADPIQFSIGECKDLAPY